MTIVPPSTIPVGLAPFVPVGGLITKSTAYDRDCSAEGNAFVMTGISAQAGIYGSTTPELGVFLSIGGGAWLFSAGVSVGPTLTIIFGPVTDFTGVSWGLGIDVNAFSGLARLSAPWPSFRTPAVLPLLQPGGSWGSQSV